MDKRGNVLVIDDDPVFQQLIGIILREQGFESCAVAETDGTLDATLCDSAAAVLLDCDLNGQDGLALLPRLRQELGATPVIVVTGSENAGQLAVRAIQSGAFDFIAKPVDTARLFASLTKAVEHGRLLHVLEAAGTAGDELGFSGMVGRSPQMRTAFDIIRRVAPTDVSVMISGESGTGKELVARAIHQNSPRQRKPFVAINMAALPKELVESTLFGHEKGAFTGADRQRAGACEEARGGTLFLDEIGEMPLDLQAKLLRFLQERVSRRVGGNADIAADVRVISATNRNPVAEVRAGRLRTDLYYRLNVIPIQLSPLRERQGDVELLAIHAVQVAARRHGKAFTSIQPAAMEMLVRCPWPGNVRQLANLIERCVVLNEGHVLTSAMLPDDVTMSESMESQPLAMHEDGEEEESEGTIIPLEELERRAITEALRICGGSPGRAARALHISEATMYRKIRAYGLNMRAEAALGVR